MQRFPSILILSLTVAAFGCPVLQAGDDAQATVKLFDGRDLSQWTYSLQSRSASWGDVWSVQDGILVCKGQPRGYLRTKEDFQNYRLTLQWRFPAGSQGGNSGVLVHTSTPEELGIWPKSIEVQLHRGNAGDFWVIGTHLDVENADQRRKGRRHLNLTDDSEHPIGEWNEMEITCRDDEILVKVNGDLVNRATQCSVTRGSICLQSEGAEIHFRNIQLTPLRPN